MEYVCCFETGQTIPRPETPQEVRKRQRAEERAVRAAVKSELRRAMYSEKLEWARHYLASADLDATVPIHFDVILSKESGPSEKGHFTLVHERAGLPMTGAEPVDGGWFVTPRHRAIRTKVRHTKEM